VINFVCQKHSEHESWVMFSSKSFWLGAFLALLGCLLTFEILLLFTVSTGCWYNHLDISGDMTSLSEIQDRIKYVYPLQRPLFLLGDSVLGSSALIEHRIPQARSKTLTRVLTNQFAALHQTVLSLGSDGNLLTDILALNSEIHPQSGDHILLLLNFRMFSQEFSDGSKGLSRYFLEPDLPEDIQNRLIPDPYPTQETKLSDDLYTLMCRHWLLFRETQMVKTLWYYPSQKDFYQRLLESIVGTNNTQADMIEAALKQKIASYYQPYVWDKKALAFTCLQKLLNSWTTNHVHVTVVLTPQNQKFLGDYLDKPSFKKNRALLMDFMKPYLSQGIHYDDWADHYPSSMFLDHCHLTPEGNEKYANDLMRLLEGSKND
jgi:hypothetical protein